MKKKQLKQLRQLKLLTGLFVIVLIIEVFYVLHALFFQSTESLYFDGINAIQKNNRYYVTVGSNNDNDNYYEKAKLSIYDNKFNKTYEKLYNVGYNSAFFGICIDEDSIIAVGSYEKEESDHKDLVRRALIVKYNFSGDVLFEKDYSLLDNTKFTSVTCVEDGYLVTGQSVYQNTKIGSKDGGALLLKYDKEGNLLWSKTYGNNKSAIFNDLLVVNNSIYTVGTNETRIGVLCEYDLEGNFITYNDYLYTDDIGFSGIVSVGDYLYVSGSNRYGKSTDALIVRYDFNCTYINQVIYENEGTIRYNKLIQDEKDHIVAIGILSTKKVGNNKTADTFNYDGIIGKYNLDLKQVDVVTYGDERDDYFTDIQYVNGEYLVVGYSSYEDGSYLSKFIRYSEALKVLGVES